MGISRQPQSYFSDMVQVRCPPILPPAIERAASLNLMSASEYVRRCIIDRLKAVGVPLDEVA
jgi:predicted HicB family RNase H-like nuclease